MNPSTLLTTTTADLRAQIARSWNKPLYLLASAVPIHPITLSAILHERLPLKPQLAARILEVLRAEEGVRAP